MLLRCHVQDPKPKRSFEADAVAEALIIVSRLMDLLPPTWAGAV